MRTKLFTTLAAIALVAACGKAANEPEADARRIDAAAQAPMTVSAPSGRPESQLAARAKIAGLTAANEALDDKMSAQNPGSDLMFGQESIAPTMIIRTGTSSIEVDSLADGVARVRELARRVGGFVANTSMQAGHQQIKSAMLEIRLPSSRFDEAIAGLTPIGRVESVNVTAEDVGEEFVDVTARVANAHRLEQRLIEVLATRTGKLRDVLDVEREIARVREEIERMEGRLRYLRSRTSVSTLSITVHEAYPVVGQRGSSSVIGEAFKQSWRNFVQFTARFIAALGSIIPTIVLMVGAVAAIITVIRKFGRKPKVEQQ